MIIGKLRSRRASRTDKSGGDELMRAAKYCFGYAETSRRQETVVAIAKRELA